jgi:hypothetical protein
LLPASCRPPTTVALLHVESRERRPSGMINPPTLSGEPGSVHIRRVLGQASCGLQRGWAPPIAPRNGATLADRPGRGVGRSCSVAPYGPPGARGPASSITSGSGSNSSRTTAQCLGNSSTASVSIPGTSSPRPSTPPRPLSQGGGRVPPARRRVGRGEARGGNRRCPGRSAPPHRRSGPPARWWRCPRATATGSGRTRA